MRINTCIDLLLSQEKEGFFFVTPGNKIQCCLVINHDLGQRFVQLCSSLEQVCQMVTDFRPKNHQKTARAYKLFQIKTAKPIPNPPKKISTRKFQIKTVQSGNTAADLTQRLIGKVNSQSGHRPLCRQEEKKKTSAILRKVNCDIAR